MNDSVKAQYFASRAVSIPCSQLSRQKSLLGHRKHKGPHHGLGRNNLNEHHPPAEAKS